MIMADEEKRSEIITAEAADRMLNRVSPIYDNAYVALWIYEAIGREWDALWRLIESLSDELVPETATWMLDLWERRYGITPEVGATIEERRKAVIVAARGAPPVSPWYLSQQLTTLAGQEVNVEEGVADYTFGVFYGQIITDAINQKIVDYLERHKPSHMAYTTTHRIDARILISASGAPVTKTQQSAVSGIFFCGGAEL